LTQFEYVTRPVSRIVPYFSLLELLPPYLARRTVVLPVVRMSLKDSPCASTVGRPLLGLVHHELGLVVEPPE
jgi:hypothetical protein